MRRSKTTKKHRNNPITRSYFHIYSPLTVHGHPRAQSEYGKQHQGAPVCVVRVRILLQPTHLRKMKLCTEMFRIAALGYY